ncbi:S8 family serine peptidase [Calidifontibacter sp. DB0510]|uniref:S8 family serine peptidase n=1 Tax=Metallococcus carri TaxID=1656884 RepID=A0A967B3V7_9MICO|nr:S8 family serine peptidase [Metallococcus carri]NOP36229.1 S8 family serine peptidase [Calidifontibacter sp. DB2511S]
MDTKFRYSSTGQGVQVYVVDSGINAASVDFSGQIGAGYVAAYDGGTVNDCAGHGTHVAGIIAGTTYGVAKAATIIPVRIFACGSQSARNSDIMKGLNWILSRSHVGVRDVINMSFGTGGVRDPAIDSAVSSLHDAGFTMVASGPNANIDACSESPGGIPA